MWGPIDKGNLTAKENMSGLMAVFMKDTLKTELGRAGGGGSSAMASYTRESSKTISSKVLELNSTKLDRDLRELLRREKDTKELFTTKTVMRQKLVINNDLFSILSRAYHLNILQRFSFSLSFF